ncbi:MAG: winged helix DNA-binding domain-containing protein [Actinobacteria bacterium]|nr:winged helix DNA-binding domain-containing protein [Actinomycetota bacterium]
MEIAERRARLGVRHHLAAGARAASVIEVARDLVALHSTDPASVFLAAAARLRDPEVEVIERALYEQRALVRILGMRRTMFVVPADAVPIVQAACARALLPGERRKVVQLLEESGVAADGDAWLLRAEEATVQALSALGEATAAELSKEVPALQERMRFGEGTKWAGVQGVSTRVLFLLGAQGRIVRGRPSGSWTSSQYRWSTTQAWLPGGVTEMTPESARTELVKRWLRSFGPGTVADLKWWTGWTVRDVRGALASVPTAEVVMDGGSGLVLADDLEPIPPPESWAALLPALDPTLMGWMGRQWYLGEHGPALFDRSGNPGPTLWWEGRIVGGWAQRKDGDIAMRFLEDAGREAMTAMEVAAERLRIWLGPARVTPRFRTPLERELAG